MSDRLLLQLKNDVRAIMNAIGIDGLNHEALRQVTEDRDQLIEYPVYEVARMLGRGDKWVMKQLHAGRMRCRMYGKEIRISRAEIIRFQREAEIAAEKALQEKQIKRTKNSDGSELTKRLQEIVGAQRG